MHPRAFRMRKRHERGERIERAGVDLPCLCNDDGRAVASCKRLPERRRRHCTLGIDRDLDRAVVAEAQELQCREDRCVCLLADQQVHDRRPEQPLPLDVPADPAQHRAARSGQADEIGDRRTGDEADRRAGRQAQDIEQPFLGDGFCRGGRRRSDMVTGILAPGRSQPVSRHAHRMRAADHPAVEARGQSWRAAPARRRRTRSSRTAVAVVPCSGVGACQAATAPA